MSNLLRNLLIALAVVICVWFGYTFFIKKDDSSAGIVKAGDSSTAALQAQEFLVKLQQLDKIHIGNSLFSDDRFNSLIDFRNELVPEPVGRTNPFAPTQ